MISISGANRNEKKIIKKVEKAVFARFLQADFFVVDITISDEATIKALNLEARGVDAVTDVLSFPCFEKLQLPIEKSTFSQCDFDGRRVALGSIMICRERALGQAAEFGHSYEREIGFLACHGMLHILGFDHVETEDEKIMIGHQKAVMNAVGLKKAQL